MKSMEALAETLIPEPPPLRLTEHGVLLVAGTRVPIDTVIEAYEQGKTPPEIVEEYDSLQLDDVFGVLRFYLRHREEMEAYLRERQKQSEKARERMTPLLPSRDWAERLKQRAPAPK